MTIIGRKGFIMAEEFQSWGLDSVDVANAIRYAGRECGYALNMTQINKLLYMLYGVVLVETKKRLTDETPKAWPYGPVFPRVHTKIKLQDEINDTFYNKIKDIDESIFDNLKNIVETFGRLPATVLSNWSHQENSPWDLAFKRSNGKWNTPLDDQDIFNYFYTFMGNQNAQNA